MGSLAKGPDPPTLAFLKKNSRAGGRFGYFLFFLLGGGERGVRGAGKGGGTFISWKISGGGGGSFPAGGVRGARGREGV